MSEFRALIVDDSSVMRKIIERSLRQAGLNLSVVHEAGSGSEALDLTGTPHSDALHVIQRLRRVSYDTLEDTITAEDPKAFTQSISGTVTFKLRPDLELDEYECTNERNVVNTNGTSTIVASPETTAPAIAPTK